MHTWELHGLPKDMTGLTFLDVGCWEGDICVGAVQRGAAKVLGIDYCTSPDLIRNRAQYDFDFIQMDILSEKALQLPEFDAVNSSGVLYHVENPLSFLFRLRKLCRVGGQLFLETTFCVDTSGEPIMVFHPGDSFDDNPSNWWTPNEACLFEMLKEVGFENIEVTMRTQAKPDWSKLEFGRIALRARAANTPLSISKKLLPRRPSFMPDAAGGGNRVGVARR